MAVPALTPALSGIVAAPAPVASGPDLWLQYYNGSYYLATSTWN